MTTQTRLIVRADDAGSSWSSTMGCYKACVEGIATSVEVMVPCPWVSYAAQLFNERAEIDIGIHLTLTSEWDAVKWRPLTSAGSLVDDQGFFLPLLMPREGDTRPSLHQADWSLDEIMDELRAQIELGIRLFKGASHISTHMLAHLKEFDPVFRLRLAELCAFYGLKDDAFGHGLPRVLGYPPFPREAGYRIAALIKALENLSSGTHIFIDHPAVASEELSAMGHTGYRDVMVDRVSCLETLTSNAVLQRIEALDVELISYGEL